MKSSDTSAKYSCPSSEQNEVIHDSGAADSESDIALVLNDAERVDDVPHEASVRSFTPTNVGSVVVDRIVAFFGVSRTELDSGAKNLSLKVSSSREGGGTLTSMKTFSVKLMSVAVLRQYKLNWGRC